MLNSLVVWGRLSCTESSFFVTISSEISQDVEREECHVKDGETKL